MDTSHVLAFLGALQDVRELLSGLARYCNHDGLMAIESVTGYLNQPSATQTHEVTSDMLLLATLCCPKDVGNATFHHLDPVTDIGRLALQRIGAALLRSAGTSDLDERQLTLSLAASTVQNVLAARHLCLGALQASLSVYNCFRLFRFAHECGISPLRQAAEQICLANLPCGSAPTYDDAGFVLLQHDQLQNLLQSDALQVSSELDVFRAIMAWADAAPKIRTPLVAPLVQRCVRLGTMDLGQLELLDQEPGVVASQDITRIVARAYVMRLVGMPAAAGPAASRPRDSVAMASHSKAAAASPVEMGEEEEEEGEAWSPVAFLPPLTDGVV
ncbi:hypothetical protein VOLCADRAFT_89923 [Volvox carteri f. nagariensis]|uniref:BACK domain-containing protein n=1 Tax=Volvox carteri f. nagariensis TaxID=3068 RepID=D8TT07_VOLCA|nr:uncharacterized protein VOLCADRAFT_89923 [Volvox carteri f. nagariensis]EFJ49471.1 hypothetical protein VOLCADRAFT_89923 [Volvox carteri f. nagariensis]|eukprot:XP_002949452.1 hypothetical protein VOLCADRAFT_89923 [Volvox carteri f. nagariensis]